MEFNKEIYKKEFDEFLKAGRIKKSIQTFKINLFLKKAENSLQIAGYIKDINPNEDQPKKLYWDY